VSLRLVATCALGLEEFLEVELKKLGVSSCSRQRGAVTFSGTWEDVLQTNWRLRIANRVLVELADWDGSSAEALEDGAGRLVESSRAWDGLRAAKLFDPRHSFAIRATTARSHIRDTRWVGLKVKDGIVDAQRRRFGRRASIDRKDPDTRLRVWLSGDRATLLLDTSGDPLDRRGYRVATTEAPVRETLAAACILASGWNGEGPVVDPMCGSGTLLAEAAAVALDLAPSRLRRRWAFERLPGYGQDAWEALRREGSRVPETGLRLFGVDQSPAAVEAASTNLRKAGLAGLSSLEVGDAYSFQPPAGPGLLVVNPAYGERLEENRDQWPRLGDLMKQRYAGWKAVVLAGGEGLGKHIGLRPSRRIPVRNGPLDARILLFDLY
jgi:putative N6-adenine-specific DNA methylase